MVIVITRTITLRIIQIKGIYMTTVISKKTLSQKAKLLQEKSKLTYAQSLHQVAKEIGFKNYEHFNKTKKFKIAVFSKKGGVGKTPISRNLYIDLEADCYFRTDNTFFPHNTFFQILPKQKTYNNSFPKEKLSAIYDLCRYTNFDDIQNIIEDIDLFILPTRAHEISLYDFVLIKSLNQLYKYNKPIIILSYGSSIDKREKNIKLLKNLKKKLYSYTNIHYLYMNNSTIYSDIYIYNNNDIENLNYETLPKFYLDTKTKSILQIYNESAKNRYMFRSIHQEYTKLLKLVKELINEESI